MKLTTILSLLEKNNLFITGGAGVGKSYLVHEIIKHYNKIGKNVIALGSTGISAVNIGGYTLHSFFLFGICKNLDELSLYDKKRTKYIHELKEILQKLDLLIIDEISMVSNHLMDMIYYRLEQLGFNGKVVVVGDFYQLPPIRRKEENELFATSYAFKSSSWEKFNFKTIFLKEVKRSKDKEFAHILEKIRRGVCDNEVKQYLNSLKEKKLPSYLEPTYLYGRNKEVNALNEKKLLKLKSSENFYFWQLEKSANISEQRVQNWAKSLIVDEVLHLKVGAKVIFCVNSWGEYVNGEEGEVVQLNEDEVIIKTKRKKIHVTPHTFELNEINPQTLEPQTIATIKQYPLKLAYAITIHKSQGMSIDTLICNLDSIFAPGQLYVALSRSSNPKNLAIEYSKSDFNSYLEKVIKPNKEVEVFYKGLQ